MKKVIGDKISFCLPWTQTILGTHLNERVNFMALDWVTRANHLPPMLGICVNKNNASHKAILETDEFSINIPSIKMIDVTDYTGMVSANQADKSDLFSIFYGELKSAPLIKECPLNVECKLHKVLDLPTNYFFIGDIINIYAEEQFLTEGIPDVKKIDPFLLTMPDNKFWSVGECVGRALHDGREVLKRFAQTRDLD